MRMSKADHILERVLNSNAVFRNHRGPEGSHLFRTLVARHAISDWALIFVQALGLRFDVRRELTVRTRRGR
jgi:hypothetical protein